MLSSIRVALLVHTILLVAVFVLPQPFVAADRPNIVVLLCDDLGYGDLGCYGHPHIRTPHLDQLAKNGIRLTSCYSAAPVCSPSRVGLLTGRSPNRAGVFDWIPEASRGGSGSRPMVHMRKEERTIAGSLQQAGYQTAIAGKWHCNAHFNNDQQPQPGEAGFDHWLATQNNAKPSHENPENFVRNGTPVGKIEQFSCQFVIDESLRWIDQISSEQPFFLYVPFHEPHEPVASPQDLVDSYRDVAKNENQAHYFANVTNVDTAVGRFIKGLRERGLLEETLVIFTSDNGPETLDRYSSADRSYGIPGPLRGMKLHTTEAGFRVPGIAHWPSRLRGGQTVSTPISSLDFFPTFCELANADVPADLSLDGTSLLPAVGESGDWTGKLERKKPLIWIYYNSLNVARVAMRIGKWKLLAQLNHGSLKRVSNLTSQNADAYLSAQLTEIEIYDMEADLSEQHSIADDPATPRKRLTTAFQEAYIDLCQGSHVWQ